MLRVKGAKEEREGKEWMSRILKGKRVMHQKRKTRNVNKEEECLI